MPKIVKKPIYDINGKLVYYDVYVYDDNGEKIGCFMVTPEGKLIVEQEIVCDDDGCVHGKLKWRDEYFE